MEFRKAILLVALSGHIIPNAKAFHAAINVGIKRIASNIIVIFGIYSTYLATVYGHLKLADKNIDEKSAPLFSNFIGKPNSDLRNLL